MDRADATGMAADALHAPLREQAIKAAVCEDLQFYISK